MFNQTNQINKSDLVGPTQQNNPNNISNLVIEMKPVDEIQQDEESQIRESFIQQLAKIPENPFEKINFFSRILFFWINPILKKAQKQPLSQEDIFNLQTKDSSQYNFDKFDKEYQNIQNNPKIKHKLRATFYKVYKKEIIIVVVLYFFNVTSSLLSLVSTQLLLAAYKRDDRGESIVPLLPGLFTQFICYFISSIIKSNYNFYYSQLTVRMTGALSLKIFQKTLVYPIFRNQFYKLGDILNMIQVDILQIVSFIQNVIVVAFIFPFLAVAFFISVTTVKNKSIIIILVLSTLVFFLISLIFGKIYASIQKKFMHKKDLRMRSLEEMMRGIKTIKYNSLEPFFDERIKQKREKEVKQLRILNFLSNVNNFIQNIATTMFIFLVANIVGIESYSEYMLINSSFFMILNFVSVLPYSIQNIVVGQNSMQRIDQFLLESYVYKLQPMIQDNSQTQNQSYQSYQSYNSSTYSLEINNATFLWKNSIDLKALQDSVKLSKNERQSISQKPGDIFTINNLNLKIKKGEYVVFYGDLGSGKTSILQGILGEMEVEGGEKAYQKMIKINGSISLSTQDPWIVQETVKENITFGQNFDRFRYEQALNACSLDEDIAYFVDGDQTNIGDKGDTLSGGQRKRINLARAVYKEADIYMLDDPLSALDIRVSTHIIKECLEGMLKNKTRLVFTNSLQGMRNADRVFLIQNGQITQEGSYNNINAIIQAGNNTSQYDESEEADVIQEEMERQQSQILYQSNKKPKKNSMTQNNYTRKLINSEDIQQGTIKLQVFKELISNLGGIIFVVTLILVLAGYVVSFLLANLEIQYIKDVDDPTQEEKDQQFTTMMIYCLCDFLKVVSIFLYECLFVFRMVSLSKYLHKSIIFNLLRGSFTKFYNLITTGRIMNRLSKDIYEIDIYIPKDLASITLNLGTILVSSIMCGLICSLKVIPINFVYLALSLFLAVYFLRAKRQLVRIEATSKSPILQYFSEVIRGVFYLRNCVDYKKIKDTYQQAVDIDLRNQIAINGVQYWFECITSFLSMFPIVLSCTILYFQTETSQNTAIMMATMISKTSISLINLCQSWISFETHLVNYERCSKLQQQFQSSQYIYEFNTYKNNNNRSITQEDYSDFQNLRDNPKNQNQSNSIEFKNASFKYRMDLPNCLSDVDIKIQGNQKIGVVGRTGAGKTSITLALTKIIDLDSGDVQINGKSIKHYSLKDLRSLISVVSQEPYIFEGTLQQNLDPYSSYSEQEIISAYNKCRFDNCLSFKNGLKTEISQLGDNLSEGEKQLISIGRVILQKTKIIIVDEPTSHIDASMEEEITRKLNEIFKDCLMITIAHKIKTIMNSDKILVLDHGQVQEFDHPQKLLQNQNSCFYQIMTMINKNNIN